MGEAKRRREVHRRAREDAYATGAIFCPEPSCPACGSKKIKRFTSAEIAEVPCDIEGCLACKAIWEAFPKEGYVEDPVCAEPCDNCAFRPGSPEQKDPEKWKSLIASLKPDGDGWFSGRFYCHKGVPIDQGAGPGNFLFPKKPVLMDGVILMTPSTGEPVLVEDLARMRTCSGFLRMFWKQAEKMGKTKP